MLGAISHKITTNHFMEDMVMKKLHMPSIIMAAFVAVGIFVFPGTEGVAQAGESCHENGQCQVVCGIEDLAPCIYMDCGNGTELCMKIGPS